MNNEGKMRICYVRAAFIVGVIADAINGIAMLVPEWFLKGLSITNRDIDSTTKGAIYMSSSLMIGWTVLLIWGAIKPIERRGLLIITVIPVIIGLAIATGYGYLQSYIPIQAALRVWAFQILLCILFVSAYVQASKQTRELRKKTT